MAYSSTITMTQSFRLGAGNFRVLLFSSSQLVRFKLENYFVDSPTQITSVSDPEEGVAALKKEKFDAVIAEICSNADVVFHFRQQVRKHHTWIPILFITPLFFWTDARLLEHIVKDPYSFYIPENADKKFISAKLTQVVTASHAETALHQLQNKISRNLYLASQLQQAMMPPWVYFSNSYEFSCFSQPYSSVSGDLFEWLPLDENRVLFIFGDVCGHGTHSALAMTAIQSFLKQLTLQDKERAARPCRLATAINDYFCTHLHNIVYMGTLIVYMDFSKNLIRYQNDGYMDIICIDSKTGEIIDTNPEKRGNLPLGMCRETIYRDEDNVEYNFTDSTVFLFHSDGLMDLSKDPGGDEYLNPEVYRKLAALLVSDEREEDRSIALPFHLHNSLKQFGYVYPQDDLSMVLIRKPPHLEKEYIFSCRVPTDKQAVDEICEKAGDFVNKFYGNDELAVRTELLLEEYLINVIQHGLSEYQKFNEYIAIKLCAFEKELKLIVWDRGKEWNSLSLHRESADQTLDKLNEDRASSGRGLPIISKIATQFSRQRYSGLNESIFIIPVWIPQSQESAGPTPQTASSGQQ